MGGLLDGSSPSAEVTTLLQTDADAYTWTAAAVGANNAAGYQLASEQPVMAIGGFNGSDPSPTLAQFKEYVADGQVHWFIASGSGGRSRRGHQHGHLAVGRGQLHSDHRRRHHALRPLRRDPVSALMQPESTGAANLERATTTVLDVVIPVYNEEAQLADSVGRVLEHLQAMPWSFRVTIADNASTDQTALIARRLGHAHPEVSVVHLAEKGRGRALKRAWSASESDVLVYMDVDLSTDLGALLPLVAPLVSGHSDLAIGSRLARTSRVRRGAKRELISRSYNLILRQTLRARFSDAQCGFKAIRRVAARELLPLVEDDAWFFDTELLVVAERAGLRIHEVPVDWTDDPDSRVDIVRTAIDDLLGIARLGRSLVRGTLPLDEVGERLGRTSAEAGRGRLGMQVGIFLVIGVFSTLAYAVLYLGLRTSMGPWWANFTALLATALVNTAANRRFTFGVRGPRDVVRHQVQGLLIFAAGLLVDVRLARPAARCGLVQPGGGGRRTHGGEPRRHAASLRGDEALGLRATPAHHRAAAQPSRIGARIPGSDADRVTSSSSRADAAAVADPLQDDVLGEGGPAVHQQPDGRGVGETQGSGLLGHRSLEQPVGQRRARALVDLAQSLVSAGGAAQQRDVALVVLRDVVDVALQRSRQLLQRRAVTRGSSHREQVVGRPPHHGGVELLLVAEVVVEQPARDPGLLGQRLDGQVLERSRGEQAYAEREELLASTVRSHPHACRGHVSHVTELPSTSLLTLVQYFVESTSMTQISTTQRATTLPEPCADLRRGRRLRRPRRRHQARRGRLLRLPGRRQGRHGRRHLARQHLPRGGLRRAQPAVLVQLRAQPWLVALVLPAAGDPGLPERTAEEAGVLDRFRFGVTVLDMAWDEEDDVWRVSTDHGEVTADVVITGSGGLSEPRLPEIEGIESFEGEIFHSARWNHDYDLTGKRVAVIGTGASAIQIVPEIAKQVDHLDLYQRTAPWVMPRRDRDYTAVEKFGFRHVPGFQKAYRTGIYWGRECFVPGFTVNPKLAAPARKLALKNIEDGISDPELRKAVTPDFAIGCKRILISNDYYPTSTPTTSTSSPTGSRRSRRRASSPTTAPSARWTPSSWRPVSTPPSSRSPSTSRAATVAHLPTRGASTA